MKTIYLKSITTLLLLCFAVSAPAQGQANEIKETKVKVLSIDEVLAIFFQRNLDLIAAQYTIDQSQADAIIASAIPNPTFSFQLSELSKNINKGSSAEGCNHSPGVSCGAAEYYSFSQLIDVAGKRGLRIQSSGFATQAAEQDFRDALRIFSNMVRDAYYNLLQSQKARWLAQEIVNHYQTIANANRLRLKGGDIAESDFLRVNIEAIRAESDLDKARTAVEQAKANLAMILRWPEQSMAYEAKEQWPEIKDIGQHLSQQQLIDKALELRPDLQADKLRAEQAKKELELAHRLKYPDVTVMAGYARDPSNNVLDSGFVGLSVPLPAFYQFQGEANKATVNLNQNQLAMEQTGLNIRNDVVSALATWQSTDKIVHRFEDGLLKAAVDVRDSAELAYSKGATSVLDFIDAQRSYKNIMHEYYLALIDRTNAYYDLAKSIGLEPNNTPLAPSQ